MTRHAVPLSLALLTAALALLLPELAWAQNEIASGVQRGHRYAVLVVRAAAALLLLAGFLMWTVGRLQYAGGVVMVVGVLGAIYSDRIATEIFA